MKFLQKNITGTLKLLKLHLAVSQRKNLITLFYRISFSYMFAE